MFVGKKKKQIRDYVGIVSFVVSFFVLFFNIQ